MAEPATTDPVRLALEHQKVLILDGGLATELEAHGCDLDDPLWSARVLVEEPDKIRAVHRDYLQAGADCIIAASYQASVPGFMRCGLTEARARSLLSRAVTLAVEERERFWNEPENRAGRLRPLVAASVGPYGAYLADGSEFTGDYDLDERGLRGFHRDRLRRLAASGADLLACETVPSAAEARALVALLEEIPGARGWLSFSCRDGTRLSDGGSFSEAASTAAGSHAIIAVGVNCTAPAYVQPLLEGIATRVSKPLVVYPNSGERYEAADRSWAPGTRGVDLAATAPRWVESGARLVGGCCRTRPDDVRRLRSVLLGPAEA